jgi:hypothetical protein
VGVPLSVAVPFPLSTKVTPIGRPVAGEIVIVGVGEPVVVTVKVLRMPAGKSAEAALAIFGAWLVPETVSVAAEVVAEPAEFVKTARY